MAILGQTKGLSLPWGTQPDISWGRGEGEGEGRPYLGDWVAARPPTTKQGTEGR